MKTLHPYACHLRAHQMGEPASILKALRVTLRTLVAVVVGLYLCATVARADAARTAAQHCAIQNHAPGNYFISNAPGVPHVIPGLGGTDGGARRMNDCLLDAYGVQFGVTPGAAVTAATPAAAPARPECDHILSRTPAVAARYAAGSALVARAVGASVQAGVSQDHLNTCLAAHSTPSQKVVPIAPAIAPIVGCRRKDGGVIRGGAGLCVGR